MFRTLIALTVCFGFVGAQAANGLYGIGNTGAALAGALISIDVKSGAITPVGPPLGQEYVAQQLSTIDAETQTYYLIGSNTPTEYTGVLE